MREIQGSLGRYLITSDQPYKYGRICLVYKARSESGTECCLKMFRQTPRVDGERLEESEFLRERSAQTKLHHPHILRLLDYGTAGESPFLVYPFCDGGNLRERLVGRDYLPRAEALRVLEQLASAIDHAHAEGFIHGDIKPENVLFRSSSGSALLADFGMSRYAIFDTPSFGASTNELEFKGGGSLLYLSPEQLEAGVQSSLSDVYSFALIAFEVLVGQSPFHSKRTVFRRMKAKMEGVTDDPREINPGISAGTIAALELGLAVDPESRPRTAAEFVRILKGEEGGHAPLISKGTQSKSDLRPKEAQRHANLGPGNGVEGESRARRASFLPTWKNLSDKERIGFLAAVIAAAAGVAAAVIKIAPDLIAWLL